MFCKSCGNQVDDDVKYCPGCGAEVAKEQSSGDSDPSDNINVGEEKANPAESANQNPTPNPMPQYGAYAPQGNFQPQYAQQPNPQFAPVIPGDSSKNGFAIASLVLGIISVTCCSGYGVLSILALIFGILSLKSQKRGMAIAGIVLGVVGLVFLVIVTVFYGSLLGALMEYSNGEYSQYFNY